MYGHIKIRLNNNVSTAEDLKFIDLAEFAPSTQQDTLEILQSRPYERFRLLLSKFSIKQLAIVYYLDNQELNKRICFHLSEDCKIILSAYMRNCKYFSKNEISSELLLLDFEMHL